MYRIKDLSGNHIFQVYSIIQVACPSIGLDQWISYFRHFTDPAPQNVLPRGGKGVFGPQGYIYGLCSYCVGHRPGIGRVLHVQNWCVMTPSGNSAAADFLFASVERLGRDLGCRLLRLAFLSDSQWQDGLALSDRPRLSMLLSD